MNGKSITSFLPVTYFSGTFVGSHKNWETLTKEAYAIYMTFKKLSYYLHDAKETIKCDHTPLCKFHATHT